MNKKMIFAVVVLSAIILAPFGVKSMIDKSIELKKTELANIGAFLSVGKNTGYINTTRNFNFTIRNEKKFKEYFKNLLAKKYPEYQVLLDDLLKKESMILDEFLKGIVFKGNIKNSNLNLFSDIKVYAYLYSLSSKTMNENKKASEIILSLFDKEAFALNMVFNSKSKLKTLALKDINENINTTKENGEIDEILFQILGYNIVNKSTEKKIVADLNLDKFNIKLNGKKNTNFLLDNLKYNMEYVNQFINSGNIHFENINLKENSKIKFNLGRSNATSSSFITNGVFTTKNKVSMESFKLIDAQTLTSFGNLDLNIDLNDVDYKSLKKLNKAYINFNNKNIKIASFPKDEREVQIKKIFNTLFMEITDFLHKGLSLKIDSNLQEFKLGKVKLNKIKFNLDSQIGKNNFNSELLIFNPFYLLYIIDINAKLEIQEEDLITLTKLINSKFVQIAKTYAKKEKGKVIFHLGLKKGRLKVNEREIKLPI